MLIAYNVSLEKKEEDTTKIRLVFSFLLKDLNQNSSSSLAKIFSHQPNKNPSKNWNLQYELYEKDSSILLQIDFGLYLPLSFGLFCLSSSLYIQRPCMSLSKRNLHFCGSKGKLFISFKYHTSVLFFFSFLSMFKRL